MINIFNENIPSIPFDGSFSIEFSISDIVSSSLIKIFVVIDLDISSITVVAKDLSISLEHRLVSFQVFF